MRWARRLPTLHATKNVRDEKTGQPAAKVRAPVHDIYRVRAQHRVWDFRLLILLFFFFHFSCWTCKRRKVKCDERPQRCMNCERMDITCDGYGVKLQWMDDPFSEPRTSQGHNSQGRIRIGTNFSGLP